MISLDSRCWKPVCELLIADIFILCIFLFQVGRDVGFCALSCGVKRFRPIRMNITGKSKVTLTALHPYHVSALI